MYKKEVYINDKGTVIASTDYSGDVAFYLKSNGKYIEKKFYEKKSTHEFSIFPDTGILSVIFFFKEENGTVTSEESSEFFFYKKKHTICKINKQIIDEDDDFKITYFDQDSDVTFVTFNGAHSTKKTPPFALRYILSNGWNLISVAQDNDSQYQSLSLERFISKVSILVDNKKVYSYGSSLGGYCALYYGGALDATIIAASPRNSAHSSIANPLWKDLIFEHKSFNEIPLTSKPVYIVYDSNITMDTKFIRELFLPYYKNAHLLPLNKASHNVLKSMKESGVLKLFISSVVSNSYSYFLEEYIKSKCMYHLEA